MVLSAVVAGGLRLVQAPAALMLGPLLAAIALVQIKQIDGRLSLHRSLLVGAQAVLGCRLAMEITPEVLNSASVSLPLLALLIAIILLGTMVLAVIVSKGGWLPGNVALFGLSPGAASAMILLSEAHGADPRIVAMMQYLRVLAAALAAIAVEAALGSAKLPNDAAATVRQPAWLIPLDYLAFAETLALALAGAAIASLTKRSIAVFFVPLIGGALLQVSGAGRLELPSFLLASAFAIIGWNVGLKFTRASLAISFRLLPRIGVLVAAMLALCAAASVALVLLSGVDPLSAYLALSPGGLDTMVIIATSSHVDMALVLGAQVTRLVIVMAAAPLVARLTALHGGREKGPTE